MVMKSQLKSILELNSRESFVSPNLCSKERIAGKPGMIKYGGGTHGGEGTNRVCNGLLRRGISTKANVLQPINSIFSFKVAITKRSKPIVHFFSGLFQAAVVIAYTTYLTWSALSHEPDDLCNPPGYVISGYDQTTGLSMQGIVSGVFVFVMLIYASFSTAMSASKLSKFTRNRVSFWKMHEYKELRVQQSPRIEQIENN